MELLNLVIFMMQETTSTQPTGTYMRDCRDFHWKPPETLISKEHDTFKSDVWALGCTIV